MGWWVGGVWRWVVFPVSLMIFNGYIWICGWGVWGLPDLERCVVVVYCVGVWWFRFGYIYMVVAKRLLMLIFSSY